MIDADRAPLASLLRRVETFSAHEIEVALELIGESSVDGSLDGYRCLVAIGAGSEPDARDESVWGYVCFGRTPMTAATCDLYWIVVDPERRGQGVGGRLLGAMRAELESRDLRVIRVETSSSRPFRAAMAFYDSHGFTCSGRIPEFYGPDDDLVIFHELLGGADPPETAAPRERSGASAAQAPRVWDSAALYDVAFAYRDFDGECAALLGLARDLGAGEPARAVEWASGPGRHLEVLARRGLEVTGVDLSPVMVAMARQRLASWPGAAIIEGDMCETVVAPPADLAFTLLSSIHLLGSELAIVAHLRVCARSLRPGGIYVIEATHPDDLTEGGAHQSRWEERSDGTAVVSEFRFDLAHRDGPRVPMSLDISARGADCLHASRVQGIYYVPDLDGWTRIVEQVPELEWIARRGELGTSLAYEDATAWRLVLVLRRRAS